MESHEEEYQCSDCGTTVPADAKTCQKCGASLEEISEEETSNKEVFVQIPVTSHPANLSSILSLLDEKKIDYSINDDAMENILGSNFIQVPRLLVRGNQEEEVKEILDSIVEEENYKILDSEIIDTEYKVGAYFSIKSKESGYRVVKILATDLVGVHIRLYSNQFSARPETINPNELFSKSIKDDPMNFGAYHIPLRYESFSEEWQPEFILQGVLTEDDLVGYNVWKEEKGGYF